LESDAEYEKDDANLGRGKPARDGQNQVGAVCIEPSRAETPLRPPAQRTAGVGEPASIACGGGFRVRNTNDPVSEWPLDPETLHPAAGGGNTHRRPKRTASVRGCRRARRQC